MPSAQEMRQRIRSVGNIAQVTRALQAVSASKVRRAQQAALATRPYAGQAWNVLQHLTLQSARNQIHPLLTERAQVRSILVLLIAGDRGLAGAYNVNVVRYALSRFRGSSVPVSYVVVGRKGRDMMSRRQVNLRAEFSGLPAEPTFADVSAIGRLLVDDYLAGKADQVFLVYTDFVNLLRQVPTSKKLLPLEMAGGERVDEMESGRQGALPTYIYEPSEAALIEQIVPRFTALQVYQAVLESLASEHAARMVAMQSATENANGLQSILRLDYNKARQQAITSDILDIVGGSQGLET